MRKFGIALAALLASSAACRDRDRSHSESVEVRKPVESSPAAPATDDHEFANVRTSYENAIREKLKKIDAEISSIEKSTSKSLQDTAAKLRVQRDELATRLDEIQYQAKSSWDDFSANVTHEVEQLENDIDASLH